MGRCRLVQSQLKIKNQKLKQIYPVSYTHLDVYKRQVDNNGVVTGVENGENHAKVTIIATALDGSMVVGRKEITVNKKISPTDVTIDQGYSVDNEYMCAIAEKILKLNYTTIPEDCTKSLIEWSSSDETVATVDGGIVKFNQNGVFGNVTITATCRCV